VRDRRLTSFKNGRDESQNLPFHLSGATRRNRPGINSKSTDCIRKWEVRHELTWFPTKDLAFVSTNKEQNVTFSRFHLDLGNCFAPTNVLLDLCIMNIECSSKLEIGHNEEHLRCYCVTTKSILSNLCRKENIRWTFAIPVQSCLRMLATYTRFVTQVSRKDAYWSSLVCKYMYQKGLRSNWTRYSKEIKRWLTLIIWIRVVANFAVR
jgi:hypothetical protein